MFSLFNDGWYDDFFRSIDDARKNGVAVMIWHDLNESTSATEVPGGCIVRHFANTGIGMGMSMVFVPNVRLAEHNPKHFTKLIFSAPSERAPSTPSFPSQWDY